MGAVPTTLPPSSHTCAHVDEYLTFDHDRLDHMLADVMSILADGELERAACYFDELDEGMRRHIRIEDEVVFPLFERAYVLSAPTEVMRDEHRRIEALLEVMRGYIDRGAIAQFRGAEAQLSDLLAQHERKEERVIFPRVERAMSEEERARWVATVTARSPG